ncbi:Phosphoserine phosphatase 1 [Botrimarina colliarenosi]|uniref:Phosphoserine phosphatase 1 n=1 Tax=Botrimarina colliarenosi TaxID=2528001 RepID=A0A5C6AJT0_9BACT|nr:histidine phosphatase family protein [Botrimarina colliarenosi]TWT99889.1 Phosphoserine phosphatase 1 [Botrimarina colliarenosi]
MLKFLLVRPGATEFDQQGRIQGTLDIPLCEDGRRQTEEAIVGVAAENPTAVYTSPCQSAREAGKMIAEAVGAQNNTTVKSKPLEKMVNLNHGLWQGMLVEEVRTKQPKVYRQWQDQPHTVCPPGGETLLQAKARVGEALRKLLKKHKEGTIALVAPEPLASVVRHVLHHDEVTGLWKGSERCGLWEAIEVVEELPTGVA